MNRTRRVVVIRSNSLAFLPDAEEMHLCYRSYSFFARALRKVIRKLGLHRFIPIFYGQWKKQIKGSSLVILFDGGIDNVDLITSYIKKKNPNLRLVFWYWNPVKPRDVALSCRNIDEIWTYSRFDAEKYKMKYNPQFYSKMVNTGKSGKSVDLTFMGANKGRKESLESLKKNAESQGLKCNFRIVESKKERVDYKEYLSMIMSARCVVDIVPNQVCGLTLRPLEALFYKKKLITNYQDIVNYDFYKKENVFVIGVDDMDRLKDFVNDPYGEVNEKTIHYYCYDSWLRRIEEDKDVVK